MTEFRNVAAQGCAPILIPVQAASRPCVVCHQPILPGQLYAVRGPEHIHCHSTSRS